jgi:hypothetical protein
MLAISAARETSWRSSSTAQRSPRSVAVPGGSHSSRAASASAPPASGASSSRKREEKKWQCASLIGLDASLAHRHPGDAWLQVETAGTRSARVHDQPLAHLLDQWLVGVTVHDDVGSVSREQPFRCRTATDFVPVADVDHHSFDL